MPSDDYAAFSSGALKLKGGGVEKKKKKKKPKADVIPGEAHKQVDPETTKRNVDDTAETNESKQGKAKTEDVEAGERFEDFKAHGGKTEAELRFEEQRRRRLNERMQREGVKTHKERVEDLNRYLSTLSEHHDMPRIGPG